MYGPGKPFSELKHNEVSSTRTGACAISSAALHLAMAISSGSPQKIEKLFKYNLKNILA